LLWHTDINIWSVGQHSFHRPLPEIIKVGMDRMKGQRNRLVVETFQSQLQPCMKRFQTGETFVDRGADRSADLYSLRQQIDRIHFRIWHMIPFDNVWAWLSMGRLDFEATALEFVDWNRFQSRVENFEA